MGAAVDSFSLGNAHVLHNLRASTVLVLRDGETALWPAGTDPVSGQTLTAIRCNGVPWCSRTVSLSAGPVAPAAARRVDGAIRTRRREVIES